MLIPHAFTGRMLCFVVVIASVLCGCVTFRGHHCVERGSDFNHHDYNKIAKVFWGSLGAEDLKQVREAVCGFLSLLPPDNKELACRMLETALARYLLGFINSYEEMKKSPTPSLPSDGYELERSLLGHLSPRCVAKVVSEAGCWKHIPNSVRSLTLDQEYTVPSFHSSPPTHIFTPALAGRACVLSLLSDGRWQQMAECLASYALLYSPHERARRYCRLLLLSWSGSMLLPWLPPGRDTELRLISLLPKDAVLSVFEEFLCKGFCPKVVIAILEVTKGLSDCEHLSGSKVIGFLESSRAEFPQYTRYKWIEWCRRRR